MASFADGKSRASTTNKVLKTGHLYKQGGSYRNWKRRYFILRNSTLTYYAVEGDKSPRGVIDLSKGRGVRSKIQCQLQIDEWPLEAAQNLAFGVAVESRTYFMYGCDQAAVEDWMTVIQERIQDVGCPSSDCAGDPVPRPESMSSKIVNGGVKLVTRRRTLTDTTDSSMASDDDAYDEMDFMEGQDNGVSID